MDDALRALIATPEGRRRLAAAMAQPSRCGGMHWDAEGYLCYRDGKRSEPLFRNGKPVEPLTRRS